MRQPIQTTISMNFVKNYFLKFIFLTLFMVSCTKKNPETFTITGSISPAKADYIILQKETDIERKIIEVIDTLKVDTNGNFKETFNEVPHLYSLVLPNKKKIWIGNQ